MKTILFYAGVAAIAYVLVIFGQSFVVGFRKSYCKTRQKEDSCNQDTSKK